MSGNQVSPLALSGYSPLITMQANHTPSITPEPPFAPDTFPPPLSHRTSQNTSPTSSGSISSSSSSSSSDSDSDSHHGPLDPEDSLPTIFGKGDSTDLVAHDISGFLAQDLDLHRLNQIQSLLWMAGRPMRARPLHRYKLMGYDVLHTQQMDLHLLKYSTKLLVKPLPEYLVSHKFWTTYICPSSEFHKSATGFLLSYVWLLASPLDLQLAHDLYLLPKWLHWKTWKRFVTAFSMEVDMTSLYQVNPRYTFGDLRLGRINSIYRTRFFSTHFVRGYLYQYNRYVVYFQRNFGWILVVFVFFSLVLSAMQVGVSVSPLQEDEAFRKGTYGFVVFSVLTVAAVLGFVCFVFVGIFLFNMVEAIKHDGRMRRERRRRARGVAGA